MHRVPPRCVMDKRRRRQATRHVEVSVTQYATHVKEPPCLCHLTPQQAADFVHTENMRVVEPEVGDTKLPHQGIFYSRELLLDSWRTLRGSPWKC